MQWSADIEIDRRMLERIIATLLALAVLAERAAVRSLPVRILLFWILRRAALAAQSLVCPIDDLELPLGNAAPSANHDCDIRAFDLLRLAAGFRMVAAMLAGLLGQDDHGWRNKLRGWRTSPSRGGAQSAACGGVGRVHALAAPLNDTS